MGTGRKASTSLPNGTPRHKIVAATILEVRYTTARDVIIHISFF